MRHANNRLLSKLASGSNMQGIAQNRSVLNVREDSRTLQVAAEVEFPKKSIFVGSVFWGYGAVGSAFEWHSKGQRFESA